MTECEEVAETMREEFARVHPHGTYDDALAFVRARMPGESYTVVDNVAWSLVN